MRAGLAGARFQKSKVLNMAKAVTIKVKLVSTADTGFYYVAKKNSRTMTDKLVKKKYDPVARKHVEFKESKIKEASGTAGGFQRGLALRFYFPTPPCWLEFKPRPLPRDCGRRAWHGRARCRRA